MTLHNSWVLLDAKENRYFGFRGVIAALKRSPLFWPLASMLKLGWMAAIGEHLYSWVAIHRRVTCALPMSSDQTALKMSPIQNFFVLFLLVYVFFWNLATLPNTGIKFSERTRSIGYVLRLDQTWNMFALYPLKDDGWYVIPGRLKDGEVVDLDSYSVQSENLFLTYSCRQKVDDFLNGVISFAIRGLQFAVYRECWVWLSVKQAVGQRA